MKFKNQLLLSATLRGSRYKSGNSYSLRLCAAVATSRGTRRQSPQVGKPLQVGEPDDSRLKSGNPPTALSPTTVASSRETRPRRCLPNALPCLCVIKIHISFHQQRQNSQVRKPLPPICRLRLSPIC